MSNFDPNRFQKAYEGIPPWEIGAPQPAIVELADTIKGSILDLGCGTGENALFFAARQHEVVGVDVVPEAIRQSQEKAKHLARPPKFLVHDGLRVDELAIQFDNAIDSGFFHVLNDEDRKRYAESVAAALKPSGQLYLICFHQDEPGAHGPRRVSEKELRETFARGWTVLSIRESRYRVRTDLPDVTFSPGGAKAWLFHAQRSS
jgi:cyclopropane fatty-acyl-phospholipid synthase-like methyltransferase